MPTRWALVRNLWRTLPGIGLIGLGVVWETQFGPTVAGWGMIAAGFLLQYLLDAPRLRWSPLDWPLLILLLLGILSLFITADPALTTVQVARLAAGIAGFYGLLQWTYGRWRLLAVAVALTAAGVAASAAAPFVVEWQTQKVGFIPASIYDYFPLLAADVIHPNIMATLLVLLFPLPLAFFLSHFFVSPQSSLKAPLLAAAAAALVLLALLLTRSRAGYIAAAAAVVALLWLLRKKFWAASLAGLAIVAAVGLLAIGGEAQETPEVITGVTAASTWAFRQEVWHIATWMISDFPFTGAGMGSFNAVATRLYPFPDVPNPGTHNLYLQVAVDLGILGLVAFLALTIAMLQTGIKAIGRFGQRRETRMHALAVGAVAGQVGLLVHALVDNTLWGTRAAFMPWLVMALIVAAYMESRRSLRTAAPAVAAQAAFVPQVETHHSRQQQQKDGSVWEGGKERAQ